MSRKIKETESRNRWNWTRTYFIRHQMARGAPFLGGWTGRLGARSRRHQAGRRRRRGFVCANNESVLTTWAAQVAEKNSRRCTADWRDCHGRSRAVAAVGRTGPICRSSVDHSGRKDNGGERRSPAAGQHSPGSNDNRRYRQTACRARRHDHSGA